MNAKWLLTESKNTLDLLRRLDDSLQGSRKYQIPPDLWALLVTQAVMLSSAIATTETLQEAGL